MAPPTLIAAVVSILAILPSPASSQSFACEPVTAPAEGLTCGVQGDVSHPQPVFRIAIQTSSSGSPNVVSQDACASFCAETPGCLSFTFRQDISCTLYSRSLAQIRFTASTNPASPRAWDMACLDCTPTDCEQDLPPPPPDVTCDVQGTRPAPVGQPAPFLIAQWTRTSHPNSPLIGSYQACADQCAGTPGCLSIGFSQGFYCWNFSGRVSQLNFRPSPTDNDRSFVVHFVWDMGCFVECPSPEPSASASSSAEPSSLISSATSSAEPSSVVSSASSSEEPSSVLSSVSSVEPSSVISSAESSSAEPSSSVFSSASSSEEPSSIVSSASSSGEPSSISNSVDPSSISSSVDPSSVISSDSSSTSPSSTISPSASSDFSLSSTASETDVSSAPEPSTTPQPSESTGSGDSTDTTRSKSTSDCITTTRTVTKCYENPYSCTTETITDTTSVTKHTMTTICTTDSEPTGYPLPSATEKYPSQDTTKSQPSAGPDVPSPSGGDTPQPSAAGAAVIQWTGICLVGGIVAMLL